MYVYITEKMSHDLHTKCVTIVAVAMVTGTTVTHFVRIARYFYSVCVYMYDVCVCVSVCVCMKTEKRKGETYLSLLSIKWRGFVHIPRKDNLSGCGTHKN